MFNSAQGYDLVTPQFGIDNSAFELIEYEGFYDSISGGQDNNRWTIESTSGIQGTMGEWITSAEAGAPLNITFQSDNVFAVGGTFYVIEDGGNTPVPGIMRLTLSDGTTFFNDLSEQGMFAGFMSTGSSIKSMSIYAFGSDSTTESAAISNLTVGVVPAPASLMLLSIGLGLRRRRS